MRWIAMARYEYLKGVTVILLLPARTVTAWFPDYLYDEELRFVRGRLKFECGDAKPDSAPFPSLIAILKSKEIAVTSIAVEMSPDNICRYGEAFLPLRVCYLREDLR